MSLKFVAIKFLAILHFSIVSFVVFGFVFVSHKILMFHLILLPILILHWQTNQGVCYLTQIENKIKGKSLSKAEQQGGFSEVIFERVFGRRPSKMQLQNSIYGIMSLSWLLSLTKLFLI